MHRLASALVAVLENCGYGDRQFAGWGLKSGRLHDGGHCNATRLSRLPRAHSAGCGMRMRCGLLRRWWQLICEPVYPLGGLLPATEIEFQLVLSSHCRISMMMINGHPPAGGGITRLDVEL